MTESLKIHAAMALLEKGVDVKCAETGEQCLQWYNEGSLFIDVVDNDALETARFPAAAFMGNHKDNHFVELNEPRWREPGPMNDPTPEQRRKMIEAIRAEEAQLGEVIDGADLADA